MPRLECRYFNELEKFSVNSLLTFRADSWGVAGLVMAADFNGSDPMDGLTIAMIATLTVLLGTCVAAILGTYKTIRKARTEGERRVIARASLVTWGLLALLVPVILLAALGVLPSWIYGYGFVGVLLVGLLSSRLMNRRPVHFHRPH